MLEKAKILIVDDQPINRLSIKLSLKNKNYIFYEAKDGIDAIKKAKDVIPDIILMDAIMPNMDGFEATKKIKNIESLQRTPILMITSLDQKEDKIRALESGINDFISKPFDKHELIARCKSYIHINKLNKKYTLATINPITKYPNKIALLKDIKSKKRESLFLINIDNYEMYENFYGFEITKYFEESFLDDLKQYKNFIGEYDIYHIENGKYGILPQKSVYIKKDVVENFCKHLSKNAKDKKYIYKDYYFDANITISFSHGEKDTLYIDANSILSKAIEQKRDYLLSFDILEDLKESLKINLQMLKTIKIALKNDRIIPSFQPLYDIKKDKIYKYEALIRMIDENNNIIYPGPYFLEVAKKGKLYHKITKILFNKVIQKLREHSEIEISINISSLDIEDKDMKTYLLDILYKNQDVSKRMIFELLEDKDTQDYHEIKTFINKAKKYGVKIAIDDFGSGYSNFIRIIEFKPDIIKIDGSLIENIDKKSSSIKTVEAIKYFADKIGAKTVAEYVSKKEIFDIVKELNIDYAQGFYLGKPKFELKKEIEEMV